MRLLRGVYTELVERACNDKGGRNDRKLFKAYRVQIRGDGGVVEIGKNDDL